MQWTSQQDRRNGAVRMDAERSSVTPHHGSSNDVHQEISTRHPATSAPSGSAPLYHLPPISMTCPSPRPSMSSSRMPLFRANTVHTVTPRDYFNHFYHYKDYASPIRPHRVLRRAICIGVFWIVQDHLLVTTVLVSGPNRFVRKRCPLFKT